MGYLLDLEEDVAGLARELDKYKKIASDQGKHIHKLTVENKKLKVENASLKAKQ